MKRSLRKPPSFEEPIGLTPEELARTRERMELYDALNEEEALLVQEYGLAAGLDAIRRFYGRPAEARAYLEAHRQALQVARWGNTT